MLVRYGIPGFTGIDTRRLTRLIRETGAIPGAFGPADQLADLTIAAREEPGTDGIDLVATVTTPTPYTVGAGGFRIVAYDYGIKRTILRNLAGLGTVEVVPATTRAADVIARDPDGIFLSNGPGDPAEVAGATGILGELLGTGIPIFGICLGHQILGPEEPGRLGQIGGQLPELLGGQRRWNRRDGRGECRAEVEGSRRPESGALRHARTTSGRARRAPSIDQQIERIRHRGRTVGQRGANCRARAHAGRTGHHEENDRVRGRTDQRRCVVAIGTGR